MVRRIAAGCFVLALVVAFAADRDPIPHAGRTAAGYTVVAGDFHVHGYPVDGGLPWWELAREAYRRGLDVIALTDHNRVVFRLTPEGTEAGGVASGFSPKDQALIIPGEEITMPGADMVAAGIDREIDWHAGIAATARLVPAAGGVAIAAHPIGDDARTYDAAAFAAVDGVESAHPVMFATEQYAADLLESYRRAVRVRPRIAAIGSSDFHFMSPVGMCRTYLLVAGLNRGSVLEAIRAGRTVACDTEGRVYGRGDLVGLVAPFCAADMPAALHANGTAEKAAALLARAALALLTLG